MRDSQRELALQCTRKTVVWQSWHVTQRIWKRHIDVSYKKVQTEKLCEPELIEISCTMYIHVRAFHQLTENQLSLMILEKRKSKLPVFFLYCSSFDIVRWDMTLKKKKALLSQNLSCIIMIQCSSISSFLPNFLASPKPRKVARHISTWMNSESYIFLCFFFRIS